MQGATNNEVRNRNVRRDRFGETSAISFFTFGARISAFSIGSCLVHRSGDQSDAHYPSQVLADQLLSEPDISTQAPTSQAICRWQVVQEPRRPMRFEWLFSIFDVYHPEADWPFRYPLIRPTASINMALSSSFLRTPRSASKLI